MTLRGYGRSAYGFVAIPLPVPVSLQLGLLPFGSGPTALFWAALSGLAPISQRFKHYIFAFVS